GGVTANPRRVSYVLQPGIPVEDTAPVSTALRSRFPTLRGPDPDRFCYAASDRAGTVRAVASACDAVLVLGADNDVDTRWLAGLVRGSGAKAHVVADVGAIVPDWLAVVAAIGLVQSTSAPSALADEVTAALSGLGQLSVTRRQVITELERPSPGELPAGPKPGAVAAGSGRAGAVAAGSGLPGAVAAGSGRAGATPYRGANP